MKNFLIWFILNSTVGFSQLSVNSNSFINRNISAGSIAEAGLDFAEAVEFSPNEILLSVAILPQNLDNVIYKNWQISVSKFDIDWSNDLELMIRRTGDGQSDYHNKPQNGTQYQVIEASNNHFFSGQGWIKSIPIQLKISGLSVTLPAKSYVTEIIFTLIDN
jgi:hypothetical protein